MAKISNADIDSIRLANQASDPDAPAASYMQLYSKTGGVYRRANGGNAIKLAEVVYSSADVSSPPTDAELDSALGTPADVGAGFVGVLDDNGAGSAVWLVASDGTNWWHVSMTKAT